MTRLKIHRIKFFVFLLIFLLSQLASCDGNFIEKRQTNEPVPLDKNKENKENADKIILSEKKNAAKELSANNNAKNSSVSNNVIEKTKPNTTSKVVPEIIITTVKPPNSIIKPINRMQMPSMNSGALMRGIFVIIGLSVLVMSYMVFRSFRLTKTRAQMVRKYGILAHRQDVEMRPLPLDEDDDDDTTVFDAINISSHKIQSQDS